MIPRSTHACPNCFHALEYRDTTMIDFMELEGADLEHHLVSEGKDGDGWWFNGKTTDGWGNSPREAIFNAMQRKLTDDKEGIKKVPGYSNIWECTENTKTVDQNFVVGFYFTDETGYLNGHYPTLAEADKALLEYVSHMHLETRPAACTLLPLKTLTP